MNESTQLNCPTCQKKVFWNDEFPHRPFCSKRCQQIDFGGWASEEHSIPGEEVALHHDDEQSVSH